MNYAAVKCGVVEIEIHIQHNVYDIRIGSNLNLPTLLSNRET